jgi:CRISPR-associated protein Cmx8
MSDAEGAKAPPSVIINRLVRSYLRARTEGKTGIKLDQFENDEEKIDWPKVPVEFNDEKKRLAQSLFYDFRARHDQAFVDHFAATFFSVTQRLVEADRLELADLLTNTERRDDLKTLTLLSVSANS